MFDQILPNKRQIDILENIYGPQILIAGPGTGKTAVLILKINKLIKELKIPYQNILALTFTNKAVNEINLRLGLPDFAYTFHSFCAYLLKTKNISYKIISDYQRKKIINQISSQHGLTVSEVGVGISRYKNLASYDIDKKIILEYENALQQEKFWDFDDLLIKTYKLLKNDDVIQIQKLRKYKYIFIDEFQDTSKIQYELIRLFLGGSQNICVIGDPNQSIYSFRGADPSIFSEFKKDFVSCKTFFLNENYRSNTKIIEIINQIFPNQNILSVKNDSCDVGLVATLNQNTQAQWIIDYINSKIGGTNLLNVSSTSEKLDHNIRFSDFAVIHRNHEHALVIKEKLFDLGVPYQVIGEESLFFREETKIIYKIIKYLLGFDYEISAEEINLSNEVKLDKKFSETIMALLNLLLTSRNNKDEEYLKDFSLLINEFDHYENSYQKFIEYYDFMIVNGSYDEKSDKINLLTMHSAKGLEFNYVFLCFFNNGIIPSKNETDEDKRLFYVSVSRAKKGLFLISPKIYKKRELQVSSYGQFFNIPDVKYLEDENMIKEQKRIDKQKLKKSQIKMF